MVSRAAVDIQQDVNLGRAIRVMWTDSGCHHDAGWAKLDEFFDGTLRVLDVETIGLWMGENDDIVAVAQSRDVGNDNWMAAQVIWKPSIISKEWL